MRVVNTYSFKGGERFVKKRHSKELGEILDTIKHLDAISCLTKLSSEKTKVGQLLFSPPALNKAMKLELCDAGWTKKSNGKRGYIEPRHKFGKNRFREMDGIKDKVGLEIQFGKYAFMGYDIFSKMVIFKKLGLIECGIEVVPVNELCKHMSTGVSDFNQLLIDFKYRGESDIDIPVYVIGIGLTSHEKRDRARIQALYSRNKKAALKIVNLRKYNGSAPGPK
ncbi:MAG TPA: BglII/BstYI family type II restriction endonuclease [Candidatus Paceibacterota bacterium]